MVAGGDKIETKDEGQVEEAGRDIYLPSYLQVEAESRRSRLTSQPLSCFGTDPAEISYTSRGGTYRRAMRINISFARALQLARIIMPQTIGPR
jgi:hypothetical protein